MFWKSTLTSGGDLAAGPDKWAGTVGGAGSLPCQLTDVVTSLSLARYLVTARVLPRLANQSVAFSSGIPTNQSKEETSSGRPVCPKRPHYKGKKSR